MTKLIHLLDDDFQSQQAAKCDLLIHIGLETLQYAVIDKVRDQLKALAEFKLPESKNAGDLINALKGLPESSHEFKFPYNKIKISFDTFQFTFIPQELYLEENETKYAKFIRPSFPDIILTDTIQSLKIKNISAINSELNDSLYQIFQKPLIFNQASPFIEGIKKACPAENTSTLFIDIHTKHIQIACLNKSTLSFYNIYECISPDEFNYYILNTIEQLNLNTELCPVVLSGNIIADDEFYERIKKYFSQISFADSSSLVKYPQKFEKVLTQTYFSLICLDLCG